MSKQSGSDWKQEGVHAACSDLDRVRRSMAEDGLDAIIAFTHANFRYLTGYAPFNPKAIGVFAALLPADPKLEPAMTIGQFEEHWARNGARFRDVRAMQSWIEIDDRDALEAGTTTIRPKPVQFRRDQVYETLRSLLSEYGLSRGRVGYERSEVPAGMRDQLEAAIDGAEFVDAQPLFTRLRMIKTESEILALRKAVRLSELGMRQVFLESNPRGKTVSQLRLEYELAIMESVRDDPAVGDLDGIRVYISTGGAIGPTTGRNLSVVQEGDVIWIDPGVQVGGYAADLGRTFAVGDPGPLTSRVAAALEAGAGAGFPYFKPGVEMSRVFRATQDTIRASGLPTYTRGHFGHAVGVGFGEQAPFITPSESRVFEPGMVVAFETPYYVRGLGGFQFEDNMLITDSGYELLTTLPRKLMVI